jgi:hypothetical protein
MMQLLNILDFIIFNGLFLIIIIKAFILEFIKTNILTKKHLKVISLASSLQENHLNI